MNNKKLVFISGLHRSGTSILHRIISTSNDVSGFENTGVQEDEGQHLQTVYQPAKKFGGPGKFAFNKAAVLDEGSNLITDANRTKLLNEWGNYWNLEKQVLVEKSPPNLIRLRFLQEMFPDAYFITISRHPVAVSYATQKWSKTSLRNLIEHWIKAHSIYYEDRKFIRKELFFSYEYMAQNTQEVIRAIESFLNISINYFNQFNNSNDRYFKKWEHVESWNLYKKISKQNIIKNYESKINEFEYSLINFLQHPTLSLTQNILK